MGPDFSELAPMELSENQAPLPLKNASKSAAAVHFSMREDSISLSAPAREGTVIYQVI